MRRHRSPRSPSVVEQLAEEDSDILDANGRPYCFGRLFGDDPPPPLSPSSGGRLRAAAAERVAGCLQQLVEEDEEASAKAAAARARRHEGRRLSLSASTKAANAYRPGIDDPWTSIDFNVKAQLTLPVCFRTRVDAGLGIPKMAPIKPTVRQQRVLDATAHLASPERRAELADQRTEREAQQFAPKQDSLQKKDSYLQLMYLGN